MRRVDRGLEQLVLAEASAAGNYCMIIYSEKIYILKRGHIMSNTPTIYLPQSLQECLESVIIQRHGIIPLYAFCNTHTIPMLAI